MNKRKKAAFQFLYDQIIQTVFKNQFLFFLFFHATCALLQQTPCRIPVYRDTVATVFQAIAENKINNLKSKEVGPWLKTKKS